MSTPSTPAGSQPARAGGAAPEKKSGISGKAIFAIVLLALALVFIFSNLQTGTIHFLGWDFEMAVWVWFLIVLLVGVAVGSMFPWFMPKKKKK